jgi:hypothetical protein
LTFYKNSTTLSTMTTRKFYKTIVTIEIISDEIYKFDSLEQVTHDITYGDCSGQVEAVKNEELNGEQAATALLKQGSDPEFFNIDKDGNDLIDL